MDREVVDREWRSDWTGIGIGIGMGREGVEWLWKISIGRLKLTREGKLG